MAKELKRLAKDTAVYGLSSIIGRILNWLLVPMYVRVLQSTGDFGIVTNLYAWTALLLIILTYGMETGFFRFVNKEQQDPQQVYSTTLISIGSTSILFLILGLLFLTPISSFLGYIDTPAYVGMLMGIVALDAFTSIPFAYLRYESRPIRFATIKLVNIFLTIGLNIFFLLLCPWLYTHYPSSVSWFYIPDAGVRYIFVSNLIASFVVLLMLYPQLSNRSYQFDTALLKRMLRYSLPILAMGVAGVLNQTVDKIIFPFLFSDRAFADEQLGIYGACFKIAVIMVMFIQAFRYAFEPFIFAQNKGKDNRQAYADAMKYFIMLALLIFLGVTFYLDIIKYFVSPNYYPGLRVVPIVMVGELFFGIYYNLSLWYKLTDQTQWGAYFATFGCVVTVAIIVCLAPTYGYMACAWASFACNLLMMLASYIIGQKRYPIAYDLRSIGIYGAFATVLYIAGTEVNIDSEPFRLLYRTGLLVIFVAFMIQRDALWKIILRKK
jgi:O-antigen/teichoic acid export membrane protein